MNVFLTSPGRSGTHWLGFIIRSLFGLKKEIGLKFKYNYRRDFIDHVCHSNEVNSIYIKHIPLLDLKSLSTSMNIVCIYRDPRDAMVSAAHYLNFNYSEECLDNWGELNYRNVSFQDKLNYYIENGYHNEWYTSYIAHRLSIRNFGIKYESLVNDPCEAIKSMCKYFGAIVDTADIQRAIESNTFEILSKGRKPGTENTQSHFRKGVIGDWKNVLNKDQNNRYIKRHGFILEALSYEL